jgi:O-antigen/teichoic acid export membrane protein
VQSGLVTVASKRFKRSNTAALRFLLVAAGAMALVTVLWTAVAYVFPLHTATSIVGATWLRARPLLPVGGVWAVLLVASTPATSGLRALRAAKANLWATLAVLPFTLLFSMGGAALWGAHGFIDGSAVAAGLFVVISWTVLLRVASRDVPQATGTRADSMVRPGAADSAGSPVPALDAGVLAPLPVDG